MTLEERYEDHAIFVWTDRAPPYRWRYTVDSFQYAESSDTEFGCAKDALEAGASAARAAVASLLPPPLRDQTASTVQSNSQTAMEGPDQVESHQARLRRQASARRVQRRKPELAPNGR
jgi:hypothetical protein